MLAPLLLSLALSALSSCASYTEEIADAQRAVASGELDEAIRALNARLKVDNVRQRPGELGDHGTLLMLERATLLQAMNNYDMAARDMMVVDQQLEWLDFDSGTVEEIGKYFYSDDVASYRAPVYERLLLNTLNMINFLGKHDLSGARVEARRFELMASFYEDTERASSLVGMMGLGHYLAGASYEASRSYESAARHYSKAWRYGIRSADLSARLLDLYRVSGFQGRGFEEEPFLMELVERANQGGALSWAEYMVRHQEGDTLVIVQYGMAPYRKAVRLGAGAAYTTALAVRGRHSMSPTTQARAADLIATGALTTVNFPELTYEGLPMRSAGAASLNINNQVVPLFQGMDVAQQVERGWAQIAGPILVAAITRMITRAVIGQAGRAAGGAASSSANNTTALIGVLGWIAATGTEAAMGAADTPDTRSWTTLPAHIQLARVKLPRGLHQAEVRLGARGDRQLIAAWSDRLNIVNFSRLR